ncbi:DUF4326 domain-containing protein [Actinomadura rupiterrae]|uniref:DUF4326 domain-containing protein n=1 Tax=Actinomadura rupiterrae TaxID=559627 RepID=UPI0020A2BDC2|nr:DUF4326 domain-containing protein [Actinomadura rupiterrae]MCP2339201.1 hypothetical protein [Actinomadura rupiterrae]
MSAKRIQRKRTRGSRLAEGAIYVGRGTKWGNPWRAVSSRTVRNQWHQEVWCAPGEARGVAARRYREDLLDGRLDFDVEDVRRELAGHDLACWCPLPEPGQPDHCHAAVLLEIAAEEPT